MTIGHAIYTAGKYALYYMAAGAAFQVTLAVVQRVQYKTTTITPWLYLHVTNVARWPLDVPMLFGKSALLPNFQPTIEHPLSGGAPLAS